MKSFFVLAAAVVLVFSLAACATSGATKSADPSASPVTESVALTPGLSAAGWWKLRLVGYGYELYAALDLRQAGQQVSGYFYPPTDYPAPAGRPGLKLAGRLEGNRLIFEGQKGAEMSLSELTISPDGNSMVGIYAHHRWQLTGERVR